MSDSKLMAKLELVKKALHIWAVQYHFVIPKEILKMYVHKFMHERSNISAYSNRFFDPGDAEEYRQWLSYRPVTEQCEKRADITYIRQSDVLDLSGADTEFVCVLGKDVKPYPCFESCFDGNGDLVYFDHDSLDENGDRHSPVLKPDFSYNTLRSFNYIGNCFIAKTALLKQFEGQKWNPYFWLLMLSNQKVDIRHVSKIAYADNSAVRCEKETLKTYFEQTGTAASVKTNPDGVSCTVQYLLPDQPLISIVIPTKDNVKVLKTCIDSIYTKSTYQNYEIIIADNRSEKMESLNYFSDLQKKHDNLHVVRVDAPFNFSYINNEAIKKAKGEYFVLLNNDTEVITPDWLEQMVGYASRENVGSVGVKLYYADDTLQHGGVITGKGGAAAHRWYRCEKDQKGYLYTLEAPNDVSCCTAACLMTSRKCWEELKGFNEDLTVQFNDVDYGLRLLEAGYFNVFLPSVELYHYESKSRGIDRNKKAVERFFEEVNWFKDHYGNYIEHDPFYNDGFDKNYDYKLIAGTGSN